MSDKVFSPFSFNLDDLYRNPSYRPPLKDVRTLHERFEGLKASYQAVCRQRDEAEATVDALQDQLAVAERVKV